MAYASVVTRTCYQGLRASGSTPENNTMPGGQPAGPKIGTNAVKWASAASSLINKIKISSDVESHVRACGPHEHLFKDRCPDLMQINPNILTKPICSPRVYSNTSKTSLHALLESHLYINSIYTDSLAPVDITIACGPGSKVF